MALGHVAQFVRQHGSQFVARGRHRDQPHLEAEPAAGQREGVDDAILEGIGVGATGWVAGLVNAFPTESVALFEAGMSGDKKRADELYRWFLPLLRMDTVPKFVQLIKLVQQEVGKGSERVRPPRLQVVGREREEALTILRQALAKRPRL